MIDESHSLTQHTPFGTYNDENIPSYAESCDISCVRVVGFVHGS